MDNQETVVWTHRMHTCENSRQTKSQHVDRRLVSKEFYHCTRRYWQLREGESIFFKNETPDRSMMLKWKTTYSGINEQHRLDSVFGKIKKEGRAQKIRCVQKWRMDLGRAGIGSEYNQDTLPKVLSKLNIFFFKKKNLSAKYSLKIFLVNFSTVGKMSMPNTSQNVFS